MFDVINQVLYTHVFIRFDIIYASHLGGEVDKDISYEQIENCIRSASESYLQSLRIFDVYAGKNIAQDKKSIAFRITWGSNKKTLSEDDINKEASYHIYYKTCVQLWVQA